MPEAPSSSSSSDKWKDMDWSHYDAEDQAMLQYLKDHDMYQAAVDLMQVLDARTAADKGEADYKSPEGSPRSSPVTVPEEDNDDVEEINSQEQEVFKNTLVLDQDPNASGEDSDKEDVDKQEESDHGDFDNENLDMPFSMEHEIDTSTSAVTTQSSDEKTHIQEDDDLDDTESVPEDSNMDAAPEDIPSTSSTLSERSGQVLSKGKQATGVFFRKVKNTFKKVGSHRGATKSHDQEAPTEEHHDHESSSSSNSDEHSTESPPNATAAMETAMNDTQEPHDDAVDDSKIDDDVESSVDMDDLDQMLDNLDVDRDFQCWTSFRSSMVRRAEILEDSSDDDNSHPHGRRNKLQQGQTPDERYLEEEDLAQWKERLQREEVFSRRYRPSKEEQTELLDLKKFLNAGGGGDLVDMFNAFFAAAASTATTSTSNDSSAAVLQKLIHPDAKTPSSILLKRGPVLFESSHDEDQTEHEAEFILLTHGCIIAKVIPPEEQGDNFKAHVVARKFERAIEWKDVACVAPNEDEMYAWEMVFRGVKGQERLSFVTGSESQQEAWLEAMEAVLINHFVQDTNLPKDLGWQYRICHKGAYTLAVTDVEDELHFSSETLRHHDSYNGYSPLHYAVRLGNERAVEVLLTAYADPNGKDEDGLTPVYYAVHDEVSDDIVKLLKRYGAKGISKAKTDKAELFDRVTATENEREERREKKAQKEALIAQAKMSENMRLLQQRGQKIDEASDRARQLNEGASDYADLARQLKEKTKRQAAWNPFSRK